MTGCGKLKDTFIIDSFFRIVKRNGLI